MSKLRIRCLALLGAIVLGISVLAGCGGGGGGSSSSGTTGGGGATSSIPAGTSTLVVVGSINDQGNPKFALVTGQLVYTTDIAKAVQDVYSTGGTFTLESALASDPTKLSTISYTVSTQGSGTASVRSVIKLYDTTIQASGPWETITATPQYSTTGQLDGVLLDSEGKFPEPENGAGFDPNNGRITFDQLVGATIQSTLIEQQYSSVSPPSNAIGTSLPFVTDMSPPTTN